MGRQTARNYTIKNNVIHFPKKGIRGLQIIGAIPLIIGLIVCIKLATASNPQLEHIALSIGFIVIGSFFITFQTAATISDNEILKSWYGWLIKLRTKQIPLSTFNIIYLKKESYRNAPYDTPNSSSVSYHITLANSDYYSLDTELVTPEIYKHIYHINQHTSFNIKDMNAQENSRVLAEEISTITQLPIVTD